MASGEKVPEVELIEKQFALFDECLIEDEGGKCKELDAAMTGLEVDLYKAQGTKWVAKQSQLARASKRVKKAAAGFGPEHAKAADVWIAGAHAEGAVNPALLLHAQEYLFGECLLDYEEGAASPSSRCAELQDAIDSLQASLGVRGMVVSTSGLQTETTNAAAADDDNAPPAPEGFQWGGSF